MSNAQSKVYIDILHHIRAYITEKKLAYGDKIPSEREFAEMLKVGRSSVREALRALELLGMIETRRGEGTYLKDFREHNLIDLLGTFILEDSRAIGDVIQMNALLENNALQLILDSDHEVELKKIAGKIRTYSLTRNSLMRELVQLANNHLLFRIWIILSEYVTYVSKSQDKNKYSYEKLDMLVNALLKKNKEEVLTAYQLIAIGENVE